MASSKARPGPQDSSYEFFQGWRSKLLTGQPVPVFDQPQMRSILTSFPFHEPDFPLSQCVTIALVLLVSITGKSLSLFPVIPFVQWTTAVGSSRESIRTPPYHSPLDAAPWE